MKNEFLYKKNYAIFHSDLTKNNVQTVIILVKEDNRHKENNIFKSEYTDELIWMKKKTKKMKVNKVSQWVSESDDSNLNEAIKKWQQIKKAIIINETEKINISELIMKYMKDLDLTVISSASNTAADLKKHLNDTQAAADQFELKALKKIEHRCALYSTLNKTLKDTEWNAKNINNISFKN